jgi:predicted nucleic acid-binding protein
MILVDTSVWIDHFRQGDAALTAALLADQVWIHPFIVGELACGNLGNRSEVLSLLRSLPCLTKCTDEEVLLFIDQQQLMGRGIGYVDAHLLAATQLASTQIWTRDKRLNVAANELALAYTATHH